MAPRHDARAAAGGDGRGAAVPGLPNVWTQPIRNRLDMLLTGIKTPVGIKIFGPDLEVIQRLGEQIERILQGVAGTRSVYAERVTQGYFTDIRIDRAAIARYGLTIEDVQDVIQSAIGGENVTRTIGAGSGIRSTCATQRDFRENMPATGARARQDAGGAQVPLGQLAEIALTTGPGDDPRRERPARRLRLHRHGDARHRRLRRPRRRAIATQLQLPPGYTLQWTGQYEFQVRARERLQILIPIVFFIIFMLLYMTFHSVSEAIIVMLSVVYAMTGGVILQWLLGYNFSVAVWVGYIALYGVAVQTGVVMVVYLHEALDKRLRRGGELTERDILEATIDGSVLRLRPKLMTVTRRHGIARADHVEQRRRLGRDEADRRADHRRDDHVDDPRAHHHAGDLLHHEAARAPQGPPEGVPA